MHSPTEPFHREFMQRPLPGRVPVGFTHGFLHALMPARWEDKYRQPLADDVTG